MLDKNKEFFRVKGLFRVVDFLSILTFIFLWLKFSGHYDGQASTIIVVVFWTCLREYVNVNSAKRQLKIPKTGRNGGWWVIIWYLFAVLIGLFSFLNPGKYHLPTAELIAGLTFVTGEYIRSRKLRGVQLPETTASFPGSTNVIIVSPSMILQFFQKE